MLRSCSTTTSRSSCLSIVENQAQVPVTADARALPGVKKLVVVADLNPIQHVLTLSPEKAAPMSRFA